MGILASQMGSKVRLDEDMSAAEYRRYLAILHLIRGSKICDVARLLFVIVRLAVKW